MNSAAMNVSMGAIRTTDDLTTNEFELVVTHGDIEWSVFRRFSAFLALRDRLSLLGFAALPAAPQRPFSRPTTQEHLQERKQLLFEYLRSLARRPDIRTSHPFLDFLDWQVNVGNPPSLMPTNYITLVGHRGRFQLADLKWVPQGDSVLNSRCGARGSIVAVYEEGAAASRIGIMWQLIEKDVAGGLTIWRSDHINNVEQLPTASTAGDSSGVHGDGSPTNSRRPSSALASLLGISKSDVARPSKSDDIVICPKEGEICFVRTEEVLRYDRCRCIYIDVALNRIFLGLRSGFVDVLYSRSLHDGGAYADVNEPLAKIDSLAISNETILSLSGNRGRLLIVSYDKSIRVVDCESLETVCGGKLTKRLLPGQNLTKGVLGSDYRAYVGTTGGDVFIYDTNVNPPQYIGVLEPPADFPSHWCEVSALEIVADKTLLVGRKYELFVYKLATPQQPVMRISSPMRDGGTIRRILVPRVYPLLVLLHSHCVTIWHAVTGELLTAFHAHVGPICGGALLEGEQRLQTNTMGTLHESALSPSATTTTTVPCDSQSTVPDMQLITGGCGDAKIIMWEFHDVASLLQSPPEFAVGKIHPFSTSGTVQTTAASSPSVLPVDGNRTIIASEGANAAGEQNRDDDDDDADSILDALHDADFAQITTHRH